MKCFIGIVPPSPFYNEVVNLQKHFGDNRTEPHITLLPPMDIAAPDDWVSAIKTVAQTFKPIPISLTGTGYFGTRVLFISVESIQLVQLERQLVAVPGKASWPAKRVNEAYHPHLTLGRINVGFSTEALCQMELLANEMLKEPYSFTATSIRIYHKPAVHERYKVLCDVALGSREENRPTATR